MLLPESTPRTCSEQFFVHSLVVKQKNLEAEESVFSSRSAKQWKSPITVVI